MGLGREVKDELQKLQIVVGVSLVIFRCAPLNASAPCKSESGLSPSHLARPSAGCSPSDSSCAVPLDYNRTLRTQ